MCDSICLMTEVAKPRPLGPCSQWGHPSTLLHFWEPGDLDSWRKTGQNFSFSFSRGTLTEVANAAQTRIDLMPDATYSVDSRDRKRALQAVRNQVGCLSTLLPRYPIGSSVPTPEWYHLRTIDVWPKESSTGIGSAAISVRLSSSLLFLCMMER